MDYFENSNPISLYYFKNPQIGLNMFVSDIENIIYLLSVLYSKKQLKPPKDIIYTSHILRIKHRTSLLTQRSGQTYIKVIKNNPIVFSNKYNFKNLTYLFDDLFKSNKVIINKKSYLNSDCLLLLINKKKITNVIIIKTIKPITKIITFFDIYYCLAVKDSTLSASLLNVSAALLSPILALVSANLRK